MSLPPDPGHDPVQLVRYLLGLLSEEDAERLDAASIADDEVAAQLRIAEDDLVDAYVRGLLTGDTLERFESFYLASPRRRAKVCHARTFLRAVDRVTPADPDSSRNSGAEPPMDVPDSDTYATRSRLKDFHPPHLFVSRRRH
jgi:hypothetical protein